MKDRYAGENKVDETLELAEGIEKELHSIGLGAAVKMVCEELAIDRCAELLGEPEDSSVEDAILQASMEVNDKLGLDINVVFNIQGSYDIIVHGSQEQARKYEKEIKGIVSSYLEEYTVNDFTIDSDPAFGSKRANHPGECSSPHSYCKTCDMEVCDAAEAEFHRHQGCDVTELPTDMNVNSNPDRSSPVYQERTSPVDAYIHQSSLRKTSGKPYHPREDFSGEPRRMSQVIRQLDSEVPEDREEAVYLLGEKGRLEEIKRMVNDPDPDVSHMARQYVGKKSSRRINLASLKYGNAIARRMKKGDLPHYAYDILEPTWRLETDDQGNQVLVKG